MAISKVIFKSSSSAQGVTWIDATPATAAAADIISPKTAMLADGVVTQGTGSGGGTGAVVDVVEQLPGGGDHHIITGVDISDTTATASDVLNSKWFYTAAGVKTQGTATGGGGGLEYETGTISISTQSTDYEIPFANAHQSPPTYYAIVNDDGIYEAHTLSVVFSLTENQGTPGANYIDLYGLVSMARTDSSGNMGTYCQWLQYSSSSQGDSAVYPSWWANESRIRLRGTSSYQIGGTYNWIAIWGAGA